MSRAARELHVAVVGASIQDMIAYVPRLPKMGETLHGTDFQLGFGGKGANQAVQSAKLGSEVAMICRVGNDSVGRDMVQNFEGLGIDASRVLVCSDGPR